jgi:16S rRNA G527 N7-methylase RsmG
MSTSVWLGELVRQHLAGIIDVTAEQVAAFERHYELLLHWNAKINLTTVTELHEAALRHYCESVFLSTHLTGGSVADVGSGAGFPGMPIAVMHPEWTVHLIESHQRKAVFLREACRELSNVKVLATRAESVKEEYVWLVSRAVAPESLRRLKIAVNFAVLCSESDAGTLQPDRIVALPWGESRVVAIGRMRR